LSLNLDPNADPHRNHYGGEGAQMTAADCWLLGALAPMIDLHELPRGALIDPLHRHEHQAYLDALGINSRDDALLEIVFRLYRGERCIIDELQRSEPDRYQGSSVSYDLVTALLVARAAGCAGLVPTDEARRLMHFVARQLQAQFGTWKEFIIGFAATYELTRDMVDQDPEVTKEELAQFHLTATGMLQPQGLWQLVPWKLALPIEGDADVELTRRERLANVIFYRHEAILGAPDFAPSAQHWCLAVASIYRAWWGEPIDALEPGDGETMRTILDRDWGVTDRESLDETLHGLATDQHFSRLTTMQEEDSDLPQGNVLAWDLVRFMQVATSGISVGYQTLDNVMPAMSSVGQRLQQTYGSWDEMLDAFTTGRTLWQIYNDMPEEEINDPDDDLDAMIELLRADSRSPMVLVPWDYSLVL
jgi:Protein of unknown function (DUF1266)